MMSADSRSRLGAVLLLIPAPVFAVSVYATTAAAPAFESVWFGDATRAEMDGAAGFWVLAAVTIAVGVIVGSAAVILLASTIPAGAGRGWARAATVTAGIAIVAAVIYGALRTLTTGFTEPTLGEHPGYLIWTVAGYVSWPAASIALAMIAIGMRASGQVIGRGWRVLTIVAIVCGLVALVAPPFLFAVVALIVGIARLVGAMTRRDRTGIDPAS
jgi:hypothetical protein